MKVFIKALSAVSLLAMLSVPVIQKSNANSESSSAGGATIGNSMQQSSDSPDQNSINQENDFDTPWTIEIIGPEMSYTLQAPFGALLIHRDFDIDFDNRRVDNLGSIGMEWNYNTGEAWQLWKDRAASDNNTNDGILLSFGVSSIKSDIDLAAVARNVYFEDKFKSSRSAHVPILQGSVWDNVATEYRNFDTTFYVIEKRQPLDASVIVCKESAEYCNLHGARLTTTLALDSILIHKEAIANWKQVQTKALDLLAAAIIDEKPAK